MQMSELPAPSRWPGYNARQACRRAGGGRNRTYPDPTDIEMTDPTLSEDAELIRQADAGDRRASIVDAAGRHNAAPGICSDVGVVKRKNPRPLRRRKDRRRPGQELREHSRSTADQRAWHWHEETPIPLRRRGREAANGDSPAQRHRSTHTEPESPCSAGD